MRKPLHSRSDIQDYKMTPPGVYIHHSPAHAPNVICAGHLPISLTALLWTTGNDISQMPNDFAVRHWPKTRAGEARSQGISLPLCLGLGCSSAISHLPPGNLPPLDTPGFWVLGTPSPLIVPLALGVIDRGFLLLQYLGCLHFHHLCDNSPY